MNSAAIYVGRMTVPPLEFIHCYDAADLAFFHVRRTSLFGYRPTVARLGYMHRHGYTRMLSAGSMRRRAMNDAIDIAAVTAISAIGEPVRRKEDQRLLTGKGRFSDDLNMAGQVYAVMVRSPHPHARILRIDKSRALAMPGVLGVCTGEDCLADGLSPIPHSPLPQTRYDMKLTAPGGGAIFIGPQLPLPADQVRHVGEAVAMVVAEALPQALDAAEAIAVEYEELPWVISPQTSLAGGAPAVWVEAP